VVNILFYNASNPTDPDVFKWGTSRIGHSELLVPIKATDAPQPAIDEGDLGSHTKRVASALSKNIEDALEEEVSMFRAGERSFACSEDTPSALSTMRQFKKVNNYSLTVHLALSRDPPELLDS
jgi:hypothetical protein